LTNIFSGVIAGLILLVLASFSLSRTGVTAGLASIILGQMFISMIADSTGSGGVEPIPLSLQRIAGLVVMFIAVLLLLPKR
jgi:uncharacterized membrane protein YdcZ (DUF606 family)